MSNALYHFCLRLGDTSLILGQRMSEMCSNGPFLEEDIAMTNIALDLLGQAEPLLEYAAEVEGKGRSADEIAYLRSEREYYNHLLAERPNTDFAHIMVRQFFHDAYFYHYYQAMASSKDERLAALAAKSLKEVTYHLKHSSQWVVRLGDGTAESHGRATDALNELYSFTGDMFETTAAEQQLIADGIMVDPESIRNAWNETVNEVLERARLSLPENSWMHTGGRNGEHSEFLGHLLSDMQYLQRAMPGAKW